MSSIDYRKRTIQYNIVYYGPGLCGKTTNLQYIHSSLPEEDRDELISLNTVEERTLYFDYTSANLGGNLTKKGFKIRNHIYTVPGQVEHNTTRRIILRGVDGIVFVADSQAHMLAENIRMLNDLRYNLKDAWGYELDKLPLVFQFNKRDLEPITPVEEMARALCLNGEPYFEAVAIEGKGVVPTINKLYDMLTSRTPILA
jgi:signal recognition particle receptor subunit beta